MTLAHFMPPEAWHDSTRAQPSKAAFSKSSSYWHFCCEQVSPGAAQVPQLGLQHTWPSLH
jgi:hypothetical protein